MLHFCWAPSKMWCWDLIVLFRTSRWYLVWYRIHLTYLGSRFRLKACDFFVSNLEEQVMFVDRSHRVRSRLAEGLFERIAAWSGYGLILYGVCLILPFSFYLVSLLSLLVILASPFPVTCGCLWSWTLKNTLSCEAQFLEFVQFVLNVSVLSNFTCRAFTVSLYLRNCSLCVDKLVAYFKVLEGHIVCAHGSGPSWIAISSWW